MFNDFLESYKKVFEMAQNVADIKILLIVLMFFVFVMFICIIIILIILLTQKNSGKMDKQLNTIGTNKSTFSNLNKYDKNSSLAKTHQNRRIVLK